MGGSNTMTRAELERRIERLDLNSFHTNHLLELYRIGQYERIEQYLAPLENPPKVEAPSSDLAGIVAPISEAAHQLAETTGAPRGVQVLMSFPFFSLSKSKRFEPIEYNDGRVKVSVLPNVKDGMATIWDADILWWLVLQLIAKRDDGKQPEPVIVFKPYELLKYLGKSTGGSDYEALKKSLQRLSSTTIRCNLKNETARLESNFHWLDAVEVLEKGDERLMAVRVSSWLYRLAIQPQELLKLSDNYFKISGGLERWLYLLARKHAGRQRKGYVFTMRQLYERSSSKSSYTVFAKSVRKAASKNRLPEYQIIIFRDEKQVEHVSLRPRNEVLKS